MIKYRTATASDYPLIATLLTSGNEKGVMLKLQVEGRPTLSFLEFIKGPFEATKDGINCLCKETGQVYQFFIDEAPWHTLLIRRGGDEWSTSHAGNLSLQVPE
jgi:hypothetical protein